MAIKNKKLIKAIAGCGIAITAIGVGAGVSSNALGGFTGSTVNAIQASASSIPFQQVQVSDISGTTEIGPAVQSSANGTTTSVMGNILPNYDPSAASVTTFAKFSNVSPTANTGKMFVSVESLVVKDASGTTVTDSTARAAALANENLTVQFRLVGDPTTYTTVLNGTDLAAAELDGQIPLVDNTSAPVLVTAGNSLVVSIVADVSNTLPSSLQGYSIQGDLRFTMEQV